jgi:putative membrane protein
MSIRLKTLAVGAVVSSLAIAPIIAQSSRQTAPRPNPKTETTQADKPDAAAPAQAAGDEQFVKAALMGNMTEVELGTLAVRKASSPDVRAFGRRMTQDHGKKLAELKTLARSKKIEVPAALDAEHQATKDKLAALSNAAFDRGYAEEMVSAHRKTAELVKTEIENGQDPDVKALASKTLPGVEEHLKLAESLLSRAVGTGGQK